MDTLVSHLEQAAAQVIELDTEKLAHAGRLPTIVSNLIMLGALLGAYQNFPVSKEIFRKTIGESVPEKFADANLAAFDIGHEEVKKSLRK